MLSVDLIFFLIMNSQTVIRIWRYMSFFRSTLDQRFRKIWCHITIFTCYLETNLTNNWHTNRAGNEAGGQTTCMREINQVKRWACQVSVWYGQSLGNWGKAMLGKVEEAIIIRLENTCKSVSWHELGRWASKDLSTTHNFYYIKLYIVDQYNVNKGKTIK